MKRFIRTWLLTTGILTAVVTGILAVTAVIMAGIWLLSMGNLAGIWLLLAGMLLLGLVIAAINTGLERW